MTKSEKALVERNNCEQTNSSDGLFEFQFGIKFEIPNYPCNRDREFSFYVTWKRSREEKKTRKKTPSGWQKRGKTVILISAVLHLSDFSWHLLWVFTFLLCREGKLTFSLWHERQKLPHNLRIQNSQKDLVMRTKDTRSRGFTEFVIFRALSEAGHARSMFYWVEVGKIYDYCPNNLTRTFNTPETSKLSEQIFFSITSTWDTQIDGLFILRQISRFFLYNLHINFCIHTFLINFFSVTFSVTDNHWTMFI